MKEEIMRSLFGQPKALIGMIHVQALPGSPKHQQSMASIIETAVEEARIYEQTGFTGCPPTSPPGPSQGRIGTQGINDHTQNDPYKGQKPEEDGVAVNVSKIKRFHHMFYRPEFRGD